MVCMYIWRVHMSKRVHIPVCGGPSLALKITLNCSTFCTESGPLNQTQSVPMCRASPASSLWGSPASTFPGWNYRWDTMFTGHLLQLWGSKPRSSCLQGKLNHQAISPTWFGFYHYCFDCFWFCFLRQSLTMLPQEILLPPLPEH